MSTRPLGALACMLAAFIDAPAPRAQAPQGVASVGVRVTESAGIRRNEFPVRATVSLPRGAAADSGRVRLRAGDADVPAQLTVVLSWPDSSVRSLDVDFNASLNPTETREYRLEYGAGVTAAPPPGGRGLAVTEEADAIQSGNIRFNRRGAPLLLSASYRGELIGKGNNGLAVVDASGARHDLSSAEPLEVTVRKRGPLVAAIEYSGRLAVDASYGVPFTLLLEMPSSKSWLKWTVEVTDSAKRIQSLAIETPFAFGAYPWLWDLGTGNDTYGAFRNANDAAAFTQVVQPPPNGNRWKIETRAQGEMRLYETSLTPPAGSGTVASGWGHFQGPNAAVAFAIQDFGRLAGTYAIGLDGQGQSSFTFAQAGSPTTRRLVLYQHFVSTPVPIGAVTSPASMVQPPVVVVGK